MKFVCFLFLEIGSACSVLVGRPEGNNKQLGRPRHRREDNIRMNISERGWKGVDWMNLDQDRDQWLALVNKVLNLRVP
jgi:hypothetical protein